MTSPAPIDGGKIGVKADPSMKGTRDRTTSKRRGAARPADSSCLTPGASSPPLDAAARAVPVTSPALPESALPVDATPPSPAPEISAVVAANLRRLRVRHGLSLERLASRSGVSRTMLSQIELGQSTPTINILWKIARALGVTFSALITARPETGAIVLRATNAKLLTSHGGVFTSRALFPFDVPRRVEFYELELAPRSEEVAEPHPPGTVENLVVARGKVEIEAGDASYTLCESDAILFEADRRHAYRNRGDVAARLFLVMTYAETVG